MSQDCHRRLADCIALADEPGPFHPAKIDSKPPMSLAHTVTGAEAGEKELAAIKCKMVV